MKSSKRSRTARATSYPGPKRALLSALSIAGAYIGGGLIPLAPYMMLAGA
jgi:VIT1/CCC1 family predicted Fe2+/Mn2+ transporter